MRLASVKKDSQLKLTGITFETIWHNDSLSTCTLRDEAGNIVQFAIESYSMKVLVPAEPKTEDRYKLHGTVAGISVEHLFESEWDATQAQRDYEGKVARAEDASLAIEKVKVPVDVS